MTDFVEGDVIEFCGESFIVLENYGDRGRVQEDCTNGAVIDPFYWEFDGHACKLVKRG